MLQDEERKDEDESNLDVWAGTAGLAWSGLVRNDLVWG